MADNLLVGKWTVFIADENAPEGSEPAAVHFYKDGSCLVPVHLLGSESEAFPDYLFYQAFENKTIRFESGEPGMFVYRYAVAGDRLTLQSLDGRDFTFVKEEKKSIFKSKAVEVTPKAAKEPEPEREPEEHEWKCPSCGKINQNYVGTCGCGEKKPNDKLFNWAEVHPELARKPEPEEAPVVVEEPEEVKPAKPAEPEREPEAHEWKCPNCGKINQNYVGTCGCGEPKPNDKLFNWAEVHPELVRKPEPEEEPVIVEEPKEVKPAKPAEPEREPEAHEWKCPNCGKINQNYVGTCGCGEPKPNDKLFNWAEVHPELVRKAEPEEEPEPIAVEAEPKAKKDKEPEPEIEPGENEWKCPKCGKIHQKYVGTCGCGEPKPKEAGPYIPPKEVLDRLKAEEPAPVIEEAPAEEPKKQKPAEPERVAGENEWKCPKCGKINQNYVGTCGCGEGKPKPAPATE